MRKKILLMVVGVVMAAGVVSQVQAQWFLFKNPLLGKPAKEFSLRDLSGQSRSLSELRADRPAIVFFWATWCPHCVNQLADLKQHADVFVEKNIQLILVDLGEDARKVQDFMTRRGLAFDVLIDADGDVAADYGVQGVPTYVFIHKNGIVKAVEHTLREDYDAVLFSE